MKYNTFCKNLLDSGASLRTFQDFTYTPTESCPFSVSPDQLEGKKTVMLRHDVDHSPVLAHEMACVEAAFGIHSTYFILTTDGANKWWSNKELRKDYLGLIVEMQNMGHEIGLHYDFFGDYFSGGIDPKANIDHILGAFRDAGLKIVGCASHGSGRMRELLGAVGQTPYPVDYVNYRIWEECGAERKELSAGGRTLVTPAMSLKDYGLCYETYWVTRDWYFSDSGGNFWQSGHSGHIFENLDQANLAPHEAVPLMQEGEVMQILAHPIWWKDKFR